MPFEPFHLALPILDFVGILSLAALSVLLYRAYRISGNSLFLYFFTGFTILGLGEFGRFFLFLRIIFTPKPSFFFFFLNHSIALLSQVLEILGFLVIALGYTMELFGKDKALASIIVFQERRLPLTFPLVNIFSASILVYISLNAFAIYTKNKQSLTLAPLLAFILFLLSNILSILAFLLRDELIVLFSRLVYIAGLYVFLWLALKVGKTP